MLHDLQPGDPQLIGPYRLRGVLGAGGMGRVFLAESAQGRPVAVKVVRAELATDPELRVRFRQEIEVARKVSGPFTAPVIDADLDGPVLWLATAFVAGPSLCDAVAEWGPLPPGRVLKLAAGLAEGLNAIHAAGVVHRDLKPSNVLLAQDGPRLIDFGLSGASGAAALTRTGLVIGSPGFMSPEQAEGRPVGPPSDIFSLGALLAFAATGEGPFGAGSTVALIYRVMHRPADLFHVPREVRGLVGRCLVKDPALRPTARDVLAATGASRSVTTWVSPPAARAFTQRPPLTAAPEASAAPTGVPQAVTARSEVPPAVITPVGTPEAITMPVPAGAGQILIAPDLLPSVAAAEQAPRWSASDRLRPHENRRSWRRRWRPLTAAAVIAGLLGAAAGLIVTAAPDQPPAAESQRQAASIRTPSPPTLAPSASADRRRSQPVAARRKASRASASAGPAPPGGSTSPSAAPTPTSGGHGY